MNSVYLKVCLLWVALFSASLLPLSGVSWTPQALNSDLKIQVAHKTFLLELCVGGGGYYDYALTQTPLNMLDLY